MARSGLDGSDRHARRSIMGGPGRPDRGVSGATCRSDRSEKSADVFGEGVRLSIHFGKSSDRVNSRVPSYATAIASGLREEANQSIASLASRDSWYCVLLNIGRPAFVGAVYDRAQSRFERLRGHRPRLQRIANNFQKDELPDSCLISIFRERLLLLALKCFLNFRKFGGPAVACLSRGLLSDRTL